MDIVYLAHTLGVEARACMQLLGFGVKTDLEAFEEWLGSPGLLAAHSVSTDVDELLMTGRRLFQVRLKTIPGLACYKDHAW